MKRKRFSVARYRMVRYVNDIRAIQRSTGLGWTGAQYEYRYAVGSMGGERKRITRMRIVNFRRIHVPPPPPAGVTLYPREGLPIPPPLYDAFTLFDPGPNKDILFPIISILRAGSSEAEVDFEEPPTNGQPGTVHPRILLTFEYAGGGYDVYRPLYYAPLRAYIKSLFPGIDSPAGSIRLYSLTHHD